MLGFWTSAPGGAAGASAWTGLSDTPGTITASRPVVGNSGGTALEFGANALSDYLRRNGSNTITGVITADTDRTRDFGSSSVRFDKAWISQIQCVDQQGGTITPGSGRSAMFGFVDNLGTLQNNGLVDSFNMLGARAFSSYGTSLVRVSGAGCSVFGDATGAYGTAELDIDTNSSAGNFLAGSTYAYYGTARIAIPGASRKGNFAAGYVYQNYAGYTAKIEIAASGGFASGRINGTTAGNSQISVTANGGFAQGYIRHLGAVSNLNYSGIVASAQGGFAQGYVRDRIGGTGYIEATGKGGLAHGYVRADGETARITASGRGAIAIGHPRDLTTNSYITASGNGSGAFGYALNTTISATASNAFQFGPGTNALANVLKVGSAGISFKGTTGAPAAPANGEFWVNNSYIYARSNGVTCKFTNAAM